MSAASCTWVTGKFSGCRRQPAAGGLDVAAGRGQPAAAALGAQQRLQQPHPPGVHLLAPVCFRSSAPLLLQLQRSCVLRCQQSCGAQCHLQSEEPQIEHNHKTFLQGPSAAGVQRTPSLSNLGRQQQQHPPPPGYHDGYQAGTAMEHQHLNPGTAPKRPSPGNATTNGQPAAKKPKPNGPLKVKFGGAR